MWRFSDFYLFIFHLFVETANRMTFYVLQRLQNYSLQADHAYQQRHVILTKLTMRIS